MYSTNENEQPEITCANNNESALLLRFIYEFMYSLQTSFSVLNIIWVKKSMHN